MPIEIDIVRLKCSNIEVANRLADIAADSNVKHWSGSSRSTGGAYKPPCRMR